MIKLNIINMEEFLRTVNRCKGAVYMVEPGTGKTDITGQDEIQEYLRRKHRDNKGYLPLVLEIPVMIAVMVLLTAPALVKGKLSRVQGVALLVIYAVFCGIQFTL